MNSPEIKDFIRQNSHLFWFLPEDKKEDVSIELLVETVLNYGTMEAVLKLFDLIGLDKVAEVFHSSLALSNRKRGNYHEITVNYFSLLFNKYAR
jgi:hypothetical protein